MSINRIVALAMFIAGMPAAPAFSAADIRVGDAAAQGGARHIEVPVYLEAADGLDIISADIRISYDPQRLEFVAAETSGTLVEKWGEAVCNENPPGNILLPLFDECTGGSSQTITTDGLLLRLLFNVKPALVPCTAAVSVSGASLGLMPVSAPLSAVTSPGSVSIELNALCTDLSSVKVFPNPYKPGSHTSQDRSVLGNGVVFSQLTARATIRIFTIAGDLVQTLEEADGNGWCLWDAANRSGQPVASGVYLYLIENPDKSGDRAHGKAAIVR